MKLRRAQHGRVDRLLAPYARIQIEPADADAFVKGDRASAETRVLVSLDGRFRADELAMVARRLLRIAVTFGANDVPRLRRAIEVLGGGEEGTSGMAPAAGEAPAASSVA